MNKKNTKPENKEVVEKENPKKVSQFKKKKKVKRNISSGIAFVDKSESVLEFKLLPEAK